MMGELSRACGGLLILGTLALTACSTHSIVAPVGERKTVVDQQAKVHRVQRGESLFGIAWQHGLDYRTVAHWNGIKAPYTIYPGQLIRLRAPAPSPLRRATPPASPSAAPATGAGSPPRTRDPAPRAARPSVPSQPSAAASAPAERPKPPLSTETVHWQWPSNGAVVRGFDADSAGKKGIVLNAAAGDEVRAAAAGQVVYAGSGLVGYGRLIIVKHNNTYLSAYGHNRNLLVKEGEVVRAGQAIALMGKSGTDRTQLHFEIRRNGKPVDPLDYLPRRR